MKRIQSTKTADVVRGVRTHEWLISAALTHIARSFQWNYVSTTVINGICAIISIATAVMMLWLIPELFKLAKALEAERCEKLLLESFQATLNNAVEVGPGTCPACGRTEQSPAAGWAAAAPQPQHADWCEDQ